MIPPQAGSNTHLSVRGRIQGLIKEAERMLVKNYPALAADFSIQLEKMLDSIADHDFTKSIVIMVGGEVKKIYYLDIRVQERVLVADHWCTWCWIQADHTPVKMILLKGSIIYQLPACSFTQPLLALN